MTEEIWKDVVRYEGYYQVSDLGRIKSLPRTSKFYHPIGGWRTRRFNEKILKPVVSNKNISGHVVVRLYKEGVNTAKSVHVLVLEAFVGLCPDGMECCHFPDRDPGNNRLNNLRWGTPLDNAADMRIHGTKVKGEMVSNSKLTTAVVKEIRFLSLSKRMTQEQLSSRFGVSRSAVQKIISRQLWAHVL